MSDQSEEDRSARTGADHGKPADPDDKITAAVGAIHAYINQRESDRASVDAQHRENTAWQRRTSVAAIIYTVFTALLLFVGYEALSTSQQALTIGQRPYVYFENVLIRRVNKLEPAACCVFNLPGSLGQVVALTIAFMNSGNSTTAKLIVQTDCVTIDAPASPPDDPFSMFKWDGKKAVQNVIGPHQKIEIGPCAELSDELVLQVSQRMKRLFIIGEARYGDRISGGRPYKTQFAHEFLVYDPTPGRLTASAISVGHHNCTDDDCPKHQPPSSASHKP